MIPVIHPKENWLIDFIGLYAVSAIFQPYNGITRKNYWTIKYWWQIITVALLKKQKTKQLNITDACINWVIPTKSLYILIHVEK